MYNVYNYLASNPKVAIILMVLLTLLLVIIFIQSMQRIGLEKIRAVVYRSFIIAEHEFKKGDNSKKFEYVVTIAKGLIPSPFKFFITETLLRDVIQLWFDVCKDFLDDGILNNTTKLSEGEEITEETPNINDEDLEKEGEDNV